MNHPDHQPSEPRPSIRMGARLDVTTRAKVDDLAKHFHKPRASVVCHIMQWGLGRGQAETRDGGASEGPVRHLYLYVDTAWHQRVEKVASVAGMTIAPWLRAMVRQVTLTDFPVSWEAERSEKRSHDSRIYDTCFMLRLDSPSETKLQQLITQFGASKAHIIRQLLVRAKPEDFPNSSHMRPAERRAQPAQRDHSGKDRKSSP